MQFFLCWVHASDWFFSRGLQIVQTISVTLSRREVTISCSLIRGSAKLYNMYLSFLLFLHFSSSAKQHMHTTPSTASITALAHSKTNFKSSLACRLHTRPGMKTQSIGKPWVRVCPLSTVTCRNGCTTTTSCVHSLMRPITSICIRRS